MAAAKRRTPSQSRSRFLVDSVLQAAREAIATASESSLSISRIAERAGVSIGSVYQYFSSKQQMIAELSAQQAESHLSTFERKLDELQKLAPAETIEKAIQVICDLYLTQPTLLRNLLNLGPEWRKLPAVRRARDSMAERFTTYLAQTPELSRKENPKLAVFVLMSSVLGTLEAAVAQAPGEIQVEELRAELVDLCHRYLLNESHS